MYELDIDLWASVNPDTVKIEKRPVGKVAFSIEKSESPARWRTLYAGSERPQTMRLDLT